VEDEYLPEVQSMHVDPDAAEYFPVGHKKHDMWPVDDVDDDEEPAAHGLQLLAPLVAAI
jgi:hypothetical protein